MARVTAVAGTKLLETDIDLAGGSITGLTERAGIEAPLTISELIAAGDIALKNPEFLAALQKRGFTHDQAEAIAEVLTNSDVSQLATKLDLEKALHRQTWGLVGVIFAQGAFVIAVLQLLR